MDALVIVIILEARFGALSESVVTRVHDLENLAVLKTLLKNAATASSMEMFERSLQAMMD